MDTKPIQKTKPNVIKQKRIRKREKIDKDYIIYILALNNMTYCNICAEKLNRSNRNPVSCLFCHFTACRACCETYLLSETSPKCMSPECGKPWTREFIANIFTQVFVTKTIKEHRENVLFDKERALFPATQIYVEAEIEQEKIKMEIAEIDSKIHKLYNEKGKLLDKHSSLDRHNYMNKIDANKERVFIRACPDEYCRGYLSSQWKCGICDKYTCHECHIIKLSKNDETHVCNPDDVATAKLLSSDTKPCPKCATGIFKIDGCDQMFCTACNTAFSWKTGRLETNIHNPHYYEWLRRTGGEVRRNEGDQICGMELNTPFSMRLNNALFTKNVSRGFIRMVTGFIEAAQHLRHIQMPTYHTDDAENNQELRIRYMRNQITQEYFKREIQKRNKKFEKYREIFQICQLWYDTIRDIIYRFYGNISIQTITATEIEEMKIGEEVDAISEYCTECLLNIAKTYNSRPLMIKCNTSLTRQHYTRDILRPYVRPTHNVVEVET